MKRSSLSSILTLLMLILCCSVSCTAGDKPEDKSVEKPVENATDKADGKLSVLLIDGQNNHQWQQTTPLLKKILENSGQFDVEVSTTPPSPPRKPRKPAGKLTEAQQKAYDKQLKNWTAQATQIQKETSTQWKQWRPDFKKYDVVVSNYNGQSWPDEVKQNFEKYVDSGGGFVVVHAADNSFSDWPAYNKMIAVGGWGGRNETSGPMLRLRDDKWIKDTTAGRGGTHGTKIPVVVKVRKPEHPIIKGLPSEWIHPADEVYGKLRGPAENVTILATAYSEPTERGTGEHEPIMMTIDYGKGRVFHTTLGHDTVALQGTGFQITLQRGAEWAATGKVTQLLPDTKWQDNEPTVQKP